ncbi:dysbindin [Folsomia candida]|nr:dysbindin [Folsomia candida]XP_021962889.1 dysbindin [Folsomia candida]XP_035714631.1 dysbindin [Folsomia candida]
MFASLREKFYNVQEEITTSIRNLKLDRQSSKDVKKQDNCNYDAGLEILERYQSFWTDIHNKTEITAMCAAEVDEIVQSLHDNYEEQWKKVGKLSTALALIPQVIHGVQEVCDTILNLQCAFDETEDALLTLEDMIETQELREKQLDHRFQLALYQEKRMSELEDLKVQLTDEHLHKIREFEKKRAPSLKERQAHFQEAFDKDLLHYKSQGIVPKPTKTAESTPSLEEILLDEEDPFELETFLATEEEEEAENSSPKPGSSSAEQQKDPLQDKPVNEKSDAHPTSSSNLGTEEAPNG